MTTTAKLMLALSVAAALTGCATQQGKYAWGNYNGSLYRYYKDASTATQHLTELEAIVASAEKGNGKVAPGLHAELGYFLLQAGRSADARVHFEKEKAAWPESTQLMNTMIGMADKAPVKTAVKEQQ